VVSVETKTAVVLGGSGIFGSRVARALAATPGIAVRIAARNVRRGTDLAEQIGASFMPCSVDEPRSLDACLADTHLLIDAAGRFQDRDYAVAERCIARGVHYLDLADGREFVCGIGQLDVAARAAGVFVGSGASSAPTNTWAMIAALAPEFSSIDAIHLALSPGNQNPRGAALIATILTYLGQPIRVWEGGAWRRHYGWGNRTRRAFPPKVGLREVFDCELPELELFPQAWGARTVTFQAGLEFTPFHWVLTVLAGLRRLHALPSLRRLAPIGLHVSLWFFDRGSKNGSIAAWVTGRDRNGAVIERRIALVTDDDGTAAPSAPAILLGRKLLLGPVPDPGARPCMGLLELDEIRAHLEPLGIWCARSDSDGVWRRLPPVGAESPPGGPRLGT